MYKLKQRVMSVILIVFMLMPFAGFNMIQAAESIEGWSLGYSGNVDAEVTVDKETYYSGNGAMKIVNRSELAPNVYLTATTSINVVAGKTYEIGAYVKSKRTNGLYMTVSWGERYSLIPLSNTYDWTLYKVDYTAMETGLKELMFITDDVSCFWLDDVFCIEKDTEENLISNSGFDTETKNENSVNTIDMPLEDTYNAILNKDSFREEDYIKVRGGFKYMPVYEADGIVVDGKSEDWSEYPDLFMPTLSTQYQDYIIDERERDVEAVCKFAYDEKYFYLMIDVSDNINQFFVGENTYWQGDSIQMAISGMDEDFGSEIGFGYNPETGVCEVYAPSYFAEVLSDIQKKMQIKESGGAIYEIAIPWQLKFFEKPETFLFDVLINDNDGDGRRYCVELSPGISEGKYNSLFPKLQLVPGESDMYGWIQGARKGYTTDEFDFDYFIVNSGQEKLFTITNRITGDEEKVTIPAQTGIRRSFKAQIPSAGTHDLKLTVSAGGEEIDVVHQIIISDPLPTAEDGYRVKEKIVKYAEEIKTLIDKCTKKGIPTDYETASYKILELFVKHIQEDIDAESFERLEYTEESLTGIYNEAKTNLEAYLAGEKESLEVPKYVQSPITIKNQSTWATTDTNGAVEQRPVFFVGYGHFYEWLYPMLLEFNQYGANIIQAEMGPSTEIVPPVIFDNWIEGKSGEKLVGDFIIEKNVVKNGETALAISMQTETTPNHYMTIYQTVDVQPGDEYSLEGWIKAEGLTNAYIAANNWESRFWLENGTYDWKKFKYSYVVPEGQDQLVIRIGNDGPVNGLYFDDIALINKATGENILKNGGFEIISDNEDFYVDTSNFKAMERLLNRAEENNLSVCLLYSPHYFPGFLLEKYPDLEYRDVSFIKYNINHPIAKKVVEAHIEAMTEFTKKFDCISSVCVTNEPYFKTQQLPDFYTQDWQKYLEEIYGADIARLNKAYGTAYGSFAEISMTASNTDAAKSYDLKVFNDKVFSEWHRWMVGLIKERLPDIPVHMKVMPYVSNGIFKNGNVGNGTGLSNYDFYDMNGNDAWNNITEERGVLIKELWYDYLVSHKNVPVINTEDHIVPDRETHYSLETGKYNGQDIWQGGLHGRAMSTIWSWFKGYDPLGDSAGSVLFRPDSLMEIARSTLDLNRLSYEVVSIQDEPVDIGILYSDASAVNDTSFARNYYEVYAACMYNGKKAQFVVEQQIEKLNNYKLLFIPGVTMATSKTVDAIAKYIENGGKVIMLDENSLVLDEHLMPNDEEMVTFIRDNSIVFSNLAGYTDEQLQEFRGKVRDIFEKEKLNFVTLIDTKTGAPVTNTEYNLGIHDGKLILNMMYFGEVKMGQPDQTKTVQILVNGKPVTKATELRKMEGVGETVTLSQYVPKMLQIDVENCFFDTYGHWAEEYVTSLSNRGIVSGISASRYAPEKTVTRAEFLALILRAAGIDGRSYQGGIIDVETEKWYAGTVQAGVDAGIIVSDVFRPEDEITREEMCDMSVKVLEYKKGTVEMTDFVFTDSDEISLKSQVGKAVNAGIMVGMDDGSFAPHKSSTRAEAAVVVEKLIGCISK